MFKATARSELFHIQTQILSSKAGILTSSSLAN